MDTSCENRLRRRHGDRRLAVTGKPGLRSTRSAQTTAGRASGSPLEWRGLDRLFNAFAHFLAGLEVRHIFLGNRHGFSTFRVAPCSCRAVVQTEASETTDFHAITLCQSNPDGVEDLFNRDFGILRHKTGEARSENGDEVRACHGDDFTFWNAVYHVLATMGSAHAMEKRTPRLNDLCGQQMTVEERRNGAVQLLILTP